MSGYVGASGGIATGSLNLDNGADQVSTSGRNPDGFASVFAGAELRDAALSVALEGEFTPTRVDTLEASVGNNLSGTIHSGMRGLSRCSPACT